MLGNCLIDIVVGDNVLENLCYINEVQNNFDCWVFNEMLLGGFIFCFGGMVIDMLFVFGMKGEFDYDIMYDVSLNFG